MIAFDPRSNLRLDKAQHAVAHVQDILGEIKRNTAHPHAPGFCPE